MRVNDLMKQLEERVDSMISENKEVKKKNAKAQKEEEMVSITFRCPESVMFKLKRHLNKINESSRKGISQEAFLSDLIKGLK